MNKIHQWWLRTFKVITTEVAIELGLKFKRNIYGDEINLLNCRSIWIDKDGKSYRVENLYE